METAAFNFKDEETKPISTSLEAKPVEATVNFSGMTNSGAAIVDQENVWPPLFQNSPDYKLFEFFKQQEPQATHTASSNSEINEAFMNLHVNTPDSMFGGEGTSSSYFNMPKQADANNTSSDKSSAEQINSPKNNQSDHIDIFELLIKGLSSANNFVSMLTREQLHLLRSIRPGLLHDLMQEVARVRTERRFQRAHYSECAFCKTNGESEEFYSSHVLKDWRGRVLCPVLRAFHCPRCGATGDHAHTIKYCPEAPTATLGAESSLSSRRHASLVLNGAAPNQVHHSAPESASSSSNTPSSHSFWSTFQMN